MKKNALFKLKIRIKSENSQEISVNNIKNIVNVTDIKMNGLIKKKKKTSRNWPSFTNINIKQNIYLVLKMFLHSF